MEDIQYWPFEVLPLGERTEHHQHVIDFLEEAFREGYRPYVFHGSNYGGSTQSGRVGEIIHRGANRYWEVLLGVGDEAAISFFLDGFVSAGEAVLRWLRGDESASILDQLRDRIVAKPGIHGW
jgi:hypothetical protein